MLRYKPIAYKQSTLRYFGISNTVDAYSMSPPGQYQNPQACNFNKLFVYVEMMRWLFGFALNFVLSPHGLAFLW